LIIIAAT